MKPEFASTSNTGGILAKGSLRGRRFSLVECMIAFAMATLILAAAAALFSVYRGAQLMIVRRTASFAIASNRLDLLRRMTYAELVGADEEDTIVDAEGTAATDGLYRRTTVVTPQADDWNADGTPDVVLIQVSVSYPRFLSSERPNAALSTYMVTDPTIPRWKE